MFNPELRQNLRHNFVVNVLDGSFFGLALGLASFVTVIPLFVASMTDSTTLIGLVAALHIIGWQFPQLLTSGLVSRLKRFKPMVLLMTTNERLPFFGLALLALYLPQMDKNLALALTFVLILWHSFGGGFTATAWQSMINKIMPSSHRGTFYGLQSSAANLLLSGGAVASGFILGALAFPGNFALCFLLAGISMMISQAFLAATREPVVEVATPAAQQDPMRRHLRRILREDGNFRWFLLARFLVQFATMSLAFYTIYAVRTFDMSPETAGFMTGLLALSQTFSSPFIGWLGDRIGHRSLYAFGACLMALSAGIALIAPSIGWLYLAFALAGIVNSTQWATLMALTAEFGTASDRPYYIGLSNTLIAPATLLAPIIGGWLADTSGFSATFLVSILTGLVTAVVIWFIMDDPIKRKRKIGAPALAIGD